jgi:pimeloyl-ACP methyl ester carboxylesterase
MAAIALLLAPLAAGWVWTRVAVRRAEERFPMRGQRVAAEPGTNAAQLRYVEQGQGEPIVLLHGAFGGVEDFEATLMPRLSGTHRVIAFDRPGHGWSDRVRGVTNDPAVQADAICQALRALDLERVNLVGFSYGGSVALTLALREPRLVRRLILINTPSYGWGTGTSPVYWMARWPVVGAFFRHTLAVPLGTWAQAGSVERVFAPAQPTESFAASPAALALTPQRFLANAEDFCVLDDFLAAQEIRYPALEARTLLIAAPLDRVVGYHIHSKRLESDAPHAKLIAIEGAGHAMLFTHPERLALEIDRFIAVGD